jgi:hypothetical protein
MVWLTRYVCVCAVWQTCVIVSTSFCHKQHQTGPTPERNHAARHYVVHFMARAKGWRIRQGAMWARAVKSDCRAVQNITSFLRHSASVALAHAGILMYDMVSGCTVSVIDGQVWGPDERVRYSLQFPDMGWSNGKAALLLCKS